MQERIHCRTLRKIVRGCANQLSVAYKRICRHAAQDHCEEWLADNYYLLRKTADYALDALKHQEALPREGKLPRIWFFVLDAMQGDTLPDLDVALQQESGFNTKEFQALELMCKCACIVKCAEGYRQRNEQRMSLAVLTLRGLPEIDFEALLEKYSLTSRILKKDPAGIYPKMSRETRILYCKVCHEIAKKQNCEEREIAQKALMASQEVSHETSHIGEWLWEVSGRFAPKQGKGFLLFWLRILLPLISCILTGVVLKSWVVLFFYFPFFQLFRACLDWIFYRSITAEELPRMEEDGEIVKNKRMAAVVSSMVLSPQECETMKEHLSRMAMCNPDENLLFCLLADFGENARPTSSTDEINVAAMSRMIEQLNDQFQNRFVLLIRPRVWIKTQRSYGGWERKRGAILQLSDFIATGQDSFSFRYGNAQALKDCQYLILLDSDTNMLLHSARKLLATACHPLNRPVYDAQKRRVVRGYGILSPRIESDIISSGKTVFSRLINGSGGFSSYDGLCVDLNQSLFGETVFSGKGIVDVSAIHTCLRDALPQQAVLSHDILEGGFLRCGFCSDVKMTDSCPQTFASWLRRLHRWIRGDSQNTPWLFFKIPTERGTIKNPFSSAVKIFLADNLLRAICQATPLVLLVVALFSKHYSTWLVISALLMNSSAYLFSVFECLFRGGFLRLMRRYYSQVMPDALESLVRGVFFSLQAFEISKTVLSGLLIGWYRAFISRKNMLEWTTASQAESASRLGLLCTLRRRWFCGIIGILLSLFFNRWIRLSGIVLLTAVLIERAVEKTLKRPSPSLNRYDQQKLIAYCADQWRFYRDFCGEEDHFLPPDNYQEAPIKRIAHRTSPTNIGFYLLSLIAVLKWGFITQEEFLQRVGATLNSVEKLEKYHGHLLNWYDTKTLKVLQPQYCSTVDSGNFVGCLIALSAMLKEINSSHAKELSALADQLIRQTDFSVLYHKQRKLFHIGYDLQTQKLSDSYYDLLMSEARLTSYISVTSGQVPAQHWSQLGRMVVQEGAYTGAVSWSGTAFEYFMPHILLPVLQDTAFFETMAFCIYCQKREAKRLQLPFGVSESGYFAFDRSLNYQYKAHGIERLALKKQRRKEYIVSPYSSFFMLDIAPRSVMKNLKRLQDEFSCYGEYGFYEAIDFTKERIGAAPQPIKSYMAHHVGMSLCAAFNHLSNGYLRKLFLSGNMSIGLELLDEKIPSGSRVFRDQYEAIEIKAAPKWGGKGDSATGIDFLNPKTFLYSNGSLSALLTDSGLCRLRWNQLELLRWERDRFHLPKGIFAAIRFSDGEAMTLQSAPAMHSVDHCSSRFSKSFADYFAENRFCSAGMRISLHPSLPIFQITLRVRRKQPQKDMRTIVYFEPLLGNLEAFEAHKAYSMLFVQGKQTGENEFCFERKTKNSEQPACMAIKVLCGHLESFEISREKVLDQGCANEFWNNAESFSSQGNGLPDACCAFCFSNQFAQDHQEEIRIILAVEETQQKAFGLLYEEAMAWKTQKNAAKMPYHLSSLEGQISARILPAFCGCSKRSAEQFGALRQTDRIQERLWSLGISATKITVMYRYRKTEDELLLRSCIRVFQRFYSLLLPFDFVIVYQGGDGYHDDLLHRLSSIVKEEGAGEHLSCNGIYLVNRSSISPEDYRALVSFSSVILSRSGFRPQNAARPFSRLPIFSVNPQEIHHQAGSFLIHYGEFAPDGDFTVTDAHALPWTHLLANESFGCLLTDQSLGYTWAINSRENRLTPWSNDTRAVNAGERLLLKHKGRLYDLIRGCVCTFGKNYADYRGRIGCMSVQITVTVVGFCKRITVKITSDRPTEIQLCYLTVPVMGVTDSTTPFLTAVWDKKLIVSNAWSNTFSGEMQIACNGSNQSCCCDLTSVLSGKWGQQSLLPTAFPCAAVITQETVSAHENRTVEFSLEWIASQEYTVLHKKAEKSNEFQLRSNYPALDVLFNFWLPRQIKTCRLYARTAFYQSSGAYGFRDQLQDVCSLLYRDENLAGDHILRCCARQFEEGDVLHWWHEYPNRIAGVRTRCSDDLLWLCYAVSEYVRFTGKTKILTETVAFLTASPLQEGEHERYLQSVQRTPQEFSVFEHCLRAADHVELGSHGLPLIGSCDWNDGFSELGLLGKGESVWLAMFCVDIYTRMAQLCEVMHQSAKSINYLNLSSALRKSIVENAWDGDRFLRAFDDAGIPLGGKECEECAIDSLTQSFSVLTECVPKAMCETALESAVTHLVDREHQLIRLFTPPIVHRKAGYIAAYPEGIRENGGQYTHAAIWLTAALLLADRSDLGFECLMMLNPAQKYCDSSVAQKYLGEPYAIAADVYTNPSCTARAGWTQYTGAAGWYYQTVLRVLLGVEIQGDYLSIKPHLPSDFGAAELTIAVQGKTFRICFQPRKEQQVSGLYLDGELRQTISLKEDQGEILVIF